MTAEYALPPPSRQGINQRDACDAIKHCRKQGDLEAPRHEVISAYWAGRDGDLDPLEADHGQG